MQVQTSQMQTIDVLGIPFAVLTQEEALDVLDSWLGEQKNRIIVTPNPEGVMIARRNPAFADALRNADLSLADGTGIVIASIFASRRLPQRVRGVDTIFALFEKLEKSRDFTAYFLGAEPGVAKMAKEKMEARFTRLKVVGFHHGFFDSDESILTEINSLSPDIVLVCTGMPKAEIWATNNRNINARLTLCLGGTLNIMSGKATLAPPIMRKLGLEWLHRLFTNPSRFTRMLDIPRFILAVLWNALKL